MSVSHSRLKAKPMRLGRYSRLNMRLTAERQELLSSVTNDEPELRYLKPKTRILARMANFRLRLVTQAVESTHGLAERGDDERLYVCELPRQV